jgi:hypothetical protein
MVCSTSLFFFSNNIDLISNFQLNYGAILLTLFGAIHWVIIEN